MTRGAITLLHGFMGDPSDWDEVRTALPEYEIVTPRIQPAPDWDSGLRQLASELPRRSTLVGYSMGARLLLSVAMSRPELAAGLVFISGNPGIDHGSRRVRFQSDCQIASRIEQEPRRAFLAWWYGQRPFASLTVGEVQKEIERKMSYDGDDWGAILRTYSVSMQPNLWDRLATAEFPILAIAGQQDRKYAKIVADMGRLPNVDARIVPDSGHIVHREQRQEFLNILREFLSSAPSVHSIPERPSLRSELANPGCTETMAPVQRSPKE